MRAAPLAFALCLPAASLAAGAGDAPPPSALAAAARLHLERALGGFERVRLEPVPGREPLAPLPEPFTLETRACAGATLSRRMCVRVDVLVDGVVRRSVPLWFKVEAWRKVLVATATVHAGSAFDPRAFAPELRDVAALRGAPLETAGRASALRVRRQIEAGEAVLASDVAAAPAVTRNQAVTIRARAGGILVEAPGVALSGGGLGAVVRVRNPRSGEVYDARIVDDGVLAVTY